MADNTWILWLVAIVGVTVVLLSAVAFGRGFLFEGRGAKLRVDAQAPGPAAGGIKAYGVKAGRDLVADASGGAQIEIGKVEAGKDVRLKVRSDSDPKEE